MKELSSEIHLNICERYGRETFLEKDFRRKSGKTWDMMEAKWAFRKSGDECM